MDLLKSLDAALAAQKADAWLVHDFKGSNPVFTEFVGDRCLTRRAVLIAEKKRGIRILLHSVDYTKFPEYEKVVYNNRHEFRSELESIYKRSPRVLMEYSKKSELPSISYLDAGTYEMIEDIGFKVESSADIYQQIFAVWTPEDLTDHLAAVQAYGAARNVALKAIGENLGTITEGDVIQLLRKEVARSGMELMGPSVAVNANSRFPHYEPQGGGDLIKRGDWVLIDSHCHRPGKVCSDITWMAYAGEKVPQDRADVFDAVINARDIAVRLIEEFMARGERIEGWQVDKAARESIAARGYGPYFVHRLGHSLGREIHGRGVNMDDFETRDTRALIPGIAFTIEPGIYLPEYGARSEIDVFIEPNGPRVTTPIQREITLIGN
jgi:Xaa-Pro dipeptidase